MTELVARTEQGQVRGKTETTYYGETFYSFCGIPYAKAPAGDLRFKEPQLPEFRNTILNATKEGPCCPQFMAPFPFFIGNENNCLNLNIYTKKIDGNFPVMVFIHGGGFVYGSNHRIFYGAKNLLTADVVLVVINYRLGILGFLSLEDRSLNVPGNMGLKDQVMALRWIQKNIKNFGGDPNNVTIFGQSAGSASVQYLMLSPLAKGLFHKAIMQSGSVLNPWARGRRNALDASKRLGYNENSEKSILQRLIREDVKFIAKTQFLERDVFFNAVVRPFGPVIEYEHEGAFLSKDPLELLTTGNYNKVPVIIGHTSLEGIMFHLLRKVARLSLPLSLECDVPYCLNIPKGSEEEKKLANKIKEFYYKDEDITEKNIIKRFMIMGDTNFVYGILKSVQLMSHHHPVYLYTNSLDGPLGFFKLLCLSKYLKAWSIFTVISRFVGIKSVQNFVQSWMKYIQVPGVAHADDLFYLFSTLFKNNVKGSEEDICIQKFVKGWTNFAKYSDPTPNANECLDNVIWKPTVVGDFVPVFNIDKVIQLNNENLNVESFTFWEDIHKYGK